MRSSTATILLLGALAAAAVFMLIRSSGSPNRPMGVGVKSYEKWTAVVTLTNLCRFNLFYSAKVERKTDEGWPKYHGGMPVGLQGGGILRAGDGTNLTVSVVNYVQAYPWRVSVFCGRAPTKADMLRYKIMGWLVRSHLRILAPLVWSGPEILQVLGPQMEQ